MTSLFAIGSTVESLTALSDFPVPIPDPNHEYYQFAETIEVADRSEFGLGAPWTIWIFALLEYIEQRNQLKALCPGASATVFIFTPNDDGDFVTCQAKMIWSNGRKPENDWDVNLAIEFRDLVEVEIAP